MRWSEEVKNIFRPRERLRPSQWATRHRRLPQGQSAEVGPWRNEKAPYLVGMMDVCAIPGVVQVNICKAAQVGGSEALRNVLGYWADYEPDPVGLTLPDEKKGKKIFINRVLPLFRETPVLQKLMTRRAADSQSELLRLRNGFLLHLMWSGSASALASDPMRRVLNDEVDKFIEWTGREADPVSLTWKRLRTYGNRKLQVNNSTPTTRFGKIWPLFENSTYLFFYFVPCPRCGLFQRLAFSQLKWEHPEEVRSKKALAELLEDGEADLWYECKGCGGRIEEGQKVELVRAGRWSSGRFEELTEDGRIVDLATVRQFPAGTRIGMQLSSLYCLWEGWRAAAAEFLRAEGDLAATFDFRTGTLGEPFEQQVERAAAGLFSEKCRRAELPEGIVPDWAVKLLATIDTQHDHFYLVLRAWGPMMRSQRVWHGRVERFAELDKLLFHTVWPFAGGRTGERAGERAGLQPELVLIDSGGTRLGGEAASRTMEVYAWAWGHRAVVKPIKGASRSRPGLFYWPGKGQIDVRGKHKRDINIWFLDTHHYNDRLAELLERQETAADSQTGEERSFEAWQLNQRDDEVYNEHLSSLHKIVVRKGSQVAQEWHPVTAGARHDYRDCEVYQIAAAYMALVHLLEATPAERPRPQRRLGRMERFERD